MDQGSHNDAAASRKRLGRRSLHACAGAALTAALIATVAPTLAQGAGEPEFCTPMRRPFVPLSDEEIAEYRDLIIADFEAYLTEVSHYFMCLDRERARALREAREVGEQYRAFLTEHLN